MGLLNRGLPRCCYRHLVAPVGRLMAWELASFAGLLLDLLQGCNAWDRLGKPKHACNQGS